MKVILLFLVTTAFFMLNANQIAFARKNNVQSNRLVINKIKSKPEVNLHTAENESYFIQFISNAIKIEFLSSEFEEDELELDTKWNLINPIATIFNLAISLPFQEEVLKSANFIQENPNLGYQNTYILNRTLRI